MRQFTDKSGTVHTIDFTLDVFDEIHKKCGVDLLNLAELLEHPDRFLAINHPLKFAELLSIAVNAETRVNLGGKEFKDACEAFQLAWQDFFQDAGMTPQATVLERLREEFVETSSDSTATSSPVP